MSKRKDKLNLLKAAVVVGLTFVLLAPSLSALSLNRSFTKEQNTSLLPRFDENTDPVARYDNESVLYNSFNNTLDVLANDYDPDGDALTIISLSKPSHGSAYTDGKYVFYTPDIDFIGMDYFGYQISDGRGGYDQTSVSVEVINETPNRWPVAIDDDTCVVRDSIDNEIDVLANDYDPDGDILEILLVTNGTSGSTWTDGLFAYYTPDPGFVGKDQFSYQITDNKGGFDSACVNIQVFNSGNNSPPIARYDNMSVLYNSKNNTLDVLLNDEDPDEDPLSIVAVTEPEHGTAFTDGDVVYYTPDPDFIGDDFFDYRITDGRGGFDSTGVTVHVIEGMPNRHPVAVDDSALVVADSSNNKIDVLANDWDPDGDDLRIVDVSNASHGTVTYDGLFVYYTPESGFIGLDEFQYVISDRRGGGDIASVSVQVSQSGDNTPPVARYDNLSVARNSRNATLDVLANDYDPDGDPLRIVEVTEPQHGTAWTDGQMIYYTPDPGFIGDDFFDYRITDGRGGFDSTGVSVMVS